MCCCCIHGSFSSLLQGSMIYGPSLVYLKERPKLKPYMFYGLLEPGANLYVTALDIMSTSWMFH